MAEVRTKPLFSNLPLKDFLPQHGDMLLIQELMGHADVKTTEIYTHVMDKDISRLSSPLEQQNT